MYAVKIDTDLCKKDGLCAMICPDAVIQQDAKATFPKISDGHIAHCIAWCQCVAICPQGAISHSEFASTTIRAIQFEQMPTSEQVMVLLKTRRSIRAFRDKPLPNYTIERIIDGARFAPSGYNSQTCSSENLHESDGHNPSTLNKNE